MPAARRLLSASLWILSLLLIAGFLFINVVVSLPSFLVAENLLVALFIVAGLLFTRVRPALGFSILVFVSLFYAGRISRSVITVSGSLAPMWDAHAPVAVLLALLGVLSLIALRSSGGSNNSR